MGGEGGVATFLGREDSEVVNLSSLVSLLIFFYILTLILKAPFVPDQSSFT